MLQPYRASCHCGQVVIEVTLDLSRPSYRCNCSICRRTRFWPAVALPQHFRVVAGDDALTRYTFASGKNLHYFCRHCGVRVFGEGNDTPIGKMYGINIGCLEGVSEQALPQIPLTYVDGLHDRWSAPPEFVAHL